MSTLSKKSEKGEGKSNTYNLRKPEERTMTDKGFEQLAAKMEISLKNYEKTVAIEVEVLKNLDQQSAPSSLISSTLSELKVIRRSLKEELAFFVQEAKKKNMEGNYHNLIGRCSIVSSELKNNIQSYEEKLVKRTPDRHNDALKQSVHSVGQGAGMSSVSKSVRSGKPEPFAYNSPSPKSRASSIRSSVRLELQNKLKGVENDRDRLMKKLSDLESRRSVRGYNRSRDLQPSMQSPLITTSAIIAKMQLINSSNLYKFDGDSWKFPIFREEIRLHLEDGILPSHTQKMLLRNFVEGKAERVLNQNMSLSYAELIELLETRFGSSLAVTEAWIQKLSEGPNISWNDYSALSDLADLVNTANKVLGPFSLHQLNTQICLKKIVHRLPAKLISRWVQVIEKRNGCETIQDLAKFLADQSRLLNHPVYKFPARAGSYKDNDSRFIKITSKQTKSDETGSPEVREFQTNFNKNKIVPVPSFQCCTYCKDKNSKHKLTQCKDFLALSIDERLKFVQTQGLCFGCLTSKEHTSKGCRNRLSCDECNYKHPTCLHRKIQLNGKGKHKETGVGRSVDVDNLKLVEEGLNGTMSLILPVKLFSKDNPDNKILTYALVDDGSDSCFIREDIRSKLGVKGIYTKLEIKTMTDKTVTDRERLENILVESMDGLERVELPYKLYTCPDIPGNHDDIPTPSAVAGYNHLRSVKDKLYPLDRNIELGLLIGSNCPQLLCPLEIVRGTGQQAYGVRTILGWSVLGPKCVSKKAQYQVSTRRVEVNIRVAHKTKELINPWSCLDFPEHVNVSNKDSLGMSIEDKRFLDILSKQVVHRTDAHYELPLPFKPDKIFLPNNKFIAEKRLDSLKLKFQKNHDYKNDYIKFMNAIFEKGQAEPIPLDVSVEKGKVWYIPHHGVYHPRKGKIRVVFDCSAQYKGQSLNSNLLSGPDLTGNLIGVLLRFREGKIAFTGDIEGMFHQVYVRESDRNFLRFLWWKDGDISLAPQEYRMTVHLFGASSSPGCSNFSLKQTAMDNVEEFGEMAARFVRESFYVDDGCGSLDDKEAAKELLQNVKGMCSKGGFRFHKILSNNVEVLLSVPECDRAMSKGRLMDITPKGDTSLERILGVAWDPKSDTFLVKLELSQRAATRRGILSSVCSVFDPLGIVAPYVMRGKALLQDICREFKEQNKLDCWDEEVEPRYRKRWQEWLEGLNKLDQLSLPRCYKPQNFGEVKTAEIHYFSDASSQGYGQVSYLRLEDNKGVINCSFLIGKARVRPLKEVTIPRMELTAALLSARMSVFLSRELNIKDLKHYFWTDSRAVLGYINNEARRFHIFVANRVQEIRDITDVKNWRYISTKENPADLASRSVDVENFLQSCWLSGPKFLWERCTIWEPSEVPDLLSTDPEVKTTLCFLATKIEFGSFMDRFNRYSSWKRARKSVALAIRYIRMVKGTSVSPREIPISAPELENAEIVIIKSVQREFFGDEIKSLEKKHKVGKLSPLNKLDVFLDENSTLRVKGRLKNSFLENKFPIVLPKRCHISELLVAHFHERIHHQGRSRTMNEILANGYWVLGCSYLVKKLLANCVICKRVRGGYELQKMADLPKERVVDPDYPFACSAVDCFGPFYVRNGRRHEKRYGVLFTCLASRAITLDMIDSLSTDSFIKALRRFTSRRGSIKELWSDRGTNFVGASEELKREYKNLLFTEIQTYLANESCELKWKFNTPKASHMNGSVERLIGSVRKVLEVMLIKTPGLLTDDCLRTLLCECELIVNGRPLTLENLTDPDSLSPLTPNHALLINPRPPLPPPGSFNNPGEFIRKRWKRVQHLSEEFWRRWRKEYMSRLQERSKWQQPRRNVNVGDIVICKEEEIPRYKWPLAVVDKILPSPDGLVRKVVIRYGKNKILERPVHKLVVLVPNNFDSPTRSPAEEEF